ncbi:jg23717, partial [Pararge aegeria aegeria]
MERAAGSIGNVQIGNEEIYRKIRVTAIAHGVVELKLQSAEHIARRTGGRWGSKVLEQ